MKALLGRILLGDDPDAEWSPMMKFDAAMCTVDAGIMPPASAVAEWFLVQDSDALALGDIIILFDADDEQLPRIKVAEESDLVKPHHSSIGQVVGWGADLGRGMPLSQANPVPFS